MPPERGSVGLKVAISLVLAAIFVGLCVAVCQLPHAYQELIGRIFALGLAIIGIAFVIFCLLADTTSYGDG